MSISKWFPSSAPVRRACSRRGNAGTTLIETLVASVILAGGLLGLLAIFPKAYDTTKGSGHRLVLVHLANERLESLKVTDLSSPLLTNGVHPARQTDSNGDGYYPVAGFPEEYSVRWIVSDGPTTATGNPEPGVKTIVLEATLLVRYTLLGDSVPGDRSRQVVMKTCVSQ